MSRSAAANGTIGAIPPTSRKVVQSLKEIVNNCTEAEIYAMLRECNMDPNETVSRLLAQDPFHEVKSKRDKKKESKETADYKPRGGGNSSNRGGRGGTDRRSGATHYSYPESGNAHERSANRKGNGTYSHVAPYSSTSLATNKDLHKNVSSYSDNGLKNSKSIPANGGDSFSSSVQPTSGFQSVWVGGNAGQVSMADIVKKGISQNKAPGPNSSAHSDNFSHVVAAPAPLLPHHTVHSAHDRELSWPESEIGSNQHRDYWPATEHPHASAFPYTHDIDNLETTDMHNNRGNQHIKPDDTRLPNDDTFDNVNEHHIAFASTTHISLPAGNVGDTSYYVDNVYENPSTYHQYGNAYERKEAEDIATNIKKLSLENDEQAQQPKDEIRSVVIPDHLQVQSSECLNLSFGSFGTGISTGLSGINTVDHLNNDDEEQSEAEEASPAVHSNYRNVEFHEDEQIRSTSPGDLINRGAITDEAQTSVSPSQAEVIRHNIPSEAEGVQYAFHSSLPGYDFDNNHQRQLNDLYAQLHTGTQMQNTTPLQNVMAYANLSPASLLDSSVQQHVRDLSYANQSLAAKYGAMGSVGGPSASGAEAPDVINLSSSLQGLPSANATAPGPGLPHHLPVHSYTQPSLPPGPFANMTSYPFMTPSYTYMPSAFQQPFGTNSSYHQSLGSVLPQYRNNIHVGNLPQSGAVPSGYGAFGGNSTNGYGNFTLGQNANPSGSSIGYDKLESSQYKDHLLALQQLQNDNSAMYAHGNGTRTLSDAPSNAYYHNFQRQNQQFSEFRQNQLQPSQHFGSQSYHNFYHPQSEMSMEHQQLNPRNGSIAGSQVQPSKQSQQQMWHNGY